MRLVRNPNGPMKFASHGKVWSLKTPAHEVTDKEAAEILASAPKSAFLPPERIQVRVQTSPAPTRIEIPPQTTETAPDSPQDKSESENAALTEAASGASVDAGNQDAGAEEPKAQEKKKPKTLAKPGHEAPKPAKGKPQREPVGDDDENDPLLNPLDRPTAHTMTVADLPDSALRK